MHAILRPVNGVDSGATRPTFLHLLCFAAAYVAAESLSHWLRLSPDNPACLWPASGLYFAVLVLTPPAQWGRYVVTALAAEMGGDVWLSNFGLLVSACLGAGNTLEAVTGAYLVRRVCGSPFRLEGLRDVLGLVVFAGLLSPVSSATIGAAVMTMQGSLGTRGFANIWPLWWIGDAVGVLIVAPFVIVLLRRTVALRDVRWTEAGALLVTLLVVSHNVYMSDLPIAYVNLLPLLWAALRFGVPGAAVAMSVLTAMTVRYTAAGHGMFAKLDSGPDIMAFQVQLFLCVTGISALLLAAVIRQRRAALIALQRAHDELEQRVVERTQALRKSEERLRLATQVTGFGTYEYDAERKRVVACSQFCAILGLAEHSVFDEDMLLSLVHEQDRVRVAQYMVEARDPAGHGHHAVEFRICRHDDGAIRWLLDTGRTFFEGEGSARHAVRMIGTVQDITLRKEAEQRLRASEERSVQASEELARDNWQVRLLAQRLAETQERERREISRILHEGLAQDLFTLQLGLVPLRELIEGRSEAEQIIAELERLLQQSMRDLKNLSNELRPTALEHLGLVAALERHAEEFSRRSGIAVSVQASTPVPELSEHAAIAVYRAVQEALTNVAKHAVAANAAIELESDAEQLRVSVSDDGRGITPQERSKVGSLGLLAMSERFRELGGRVAISGAPGRGSRLTLEMPLLTGLVVENDSDSSASARGFA